MRLIIVRGFSLAVALGTAIPVATGGMADPMFVGPDILLSVALLLGALSPMSWAGRTLAIAHAYALGVFSVALAGQATTTGRISPLLLVAILTCLAALILLSGLKRPSTSVS